jgi:hemerythrin
MPILEWNKDFELGIKQFDEHHQHLVALLNKTGEIFTGGASQEAIGEILDKLIDYATYHFAAEEQWMTAHGYDGLAEHHNEHVRFSLKVVEIQKDFHDGRTRLSMEVLLFLKNWLTDHILKTDAEYGRFAAKFT